METPTAYKSLLTWDKASNQFDTSNSTQFIDKYIINFQKKNSKYIN